LPSTLLDNIGLTPVHRLSADKFESAVGAGAAVEQ
jgi:hypothetical protein